jgi:hypothetical protein
VVFHLTTARVHEILPVDPAPVRPVLCKVQGRGFRARGAGCRVEDYGVIDCGLLGVKGSGFRVQGLGFGVQGPGFRVQGSGCRV